MGVVWSLRVISGSARGLKLDSLDGLSTRPTLDRVKEAIFNMLFDAVVDANVLDLFAGSGALGIEALSRNAKKCTFVDVSKEAVSIINKNIQKASLEKRAQVVLKDYDSFIASCSEQFDIVFLDPPYMAGFTEDVLDKLLGAGVLSRNCVIVVESDKNCKPHFSDKYKTVKEKNYGRVNVCLLEVI